VAYINGWTEAADIVNFMREEHNPRFQKLSQHLKESLTIFKTHLDRVFSCRAFRSRFFREERSLWYIQLNGRQHNLGRDRDDAFRRSHQLMQSPALSARPSS
jgi:hypothetical protein